MRFGHLMLPLVIAVIKKVINEYEQERIEVGKKKAKEELSKEIKKGFVGFFRQQLRKNCYWIFILVLSLLLTYILPASYGMMLVGIVYNLIFISSMYYFFVFLTTAFAVLKANEWRLSKSISAVIYAKAYRKIYEGVQREKSGVLAAIFSSKSVDEVTREIASSTSEHGWLITSQILKKFLWVLLVVITLFLVLRASLPQFVGRFGEVTMLDIMHYPFTRLFELFGAMMAYFFN